MNGEEIIGVYVPKSGDGWVLMKTNKHLYSFRLGGYKIENLDTNLNNYEMLDCPFDGRSILNVYSDDEWVYVLAEGDAIIVSGWTSIDS